MKNIILFLTSTLAITSAWAYSGKFAAYKTENVVCQYTTDNAKTGVLHIDLTYLAGAEDRNHGKFRVAGNLDMTMPFEMVKADEKGNPTNELFDKQTLFRLFNSSGPSLFSLPALSEDLALSDAFNKAEDSAKYEGATYLIAGSVDESNNVVRYDNDTFVQGHISALGKRSVQAQLQHTDSHLNVIETVNISGTCK